MAARRDGEQPQARPQAGWLPVISIGLIVRAGAIVGRLGADARRFAFGAPRHREHLEHLAPAAPSADARRARATTGRTRPPGVIPGDTMPGLLGRIAYSIWVEEGRLLSLRGREPGAAQLVLPCPEVFRAMYAPHRILAIALLGGPWSGMTARRVLEAELTGEVDDGAGESGWSVSTVGGLGAVHIAVAGNLWINRRGRACADRLLVAMGELAPIEGHSAIGGRGGQVPPA